MRKAKKALSISGYVIGLYFVGRAAMQPFVIDFSDPATYAEDWGGPSLAGVLAVHCGPGIVALVLMIAAARRRRSRSAEA
ncbi:hypothetical protein [Actinoplanes sp. G11-F43]|uniref:hypothetical protein n=1 Tax=Actinoplanes sp. G11-F43 TaxID=3424130 RepID=UPI003D34BB22